MFKYLLTTIICLLGLPSLSLAEELCPQLLNTGWRGMNCLYCLHPQAPQNSGPITQLLKDTCLKNVMISFVIDGSFGWKQGEMERAVRELRQAGRNVWMHIYVYNGPAQRRWQSNVFDSFAVMDPSVFRKKIVTNTSLKAAFVRVVKTRVLPAAAFAVSMGARVSIAPGLEDSLDDVGFRMSARLLRSAMGSAVPYTLVRSSCFRCEQSVGRFRPRGSLLEEHDDQLFPYRWDGIISTDGRYFRFSYETSEHPTLQELRDTWLGRATRQRNAFLLWVPHYQDAPPGLVPRPLSERNFRGPTPLESREIIEFLRS